MRKFPALVCAAAKKEVQGLGSVLNDFDLIRDVVAS
jgi:hypothetical protein